jgi:hypothetical protein
MLVVAITVGLIPMVAEWGGRTGAFFLMCLMLAGLFSLAALALANLARCLVALAILNGLLPVRRRVTRGRIAAEIVD